jgi:hypothetical protein
MPTRYEETFKDGFLAVLADRLTAEFPEEKKAIFKEIEKATSDLIEENQTLIEDEQSRCHLAMTSLFLAAYRVLQGAVPDRASLLVFPGGELPGPGHDGCHPRQWRGTSHHRQADGFGSLPEEYPLYHV